MDTLEKLIEEFKKFPGIGPRQARRFAYYILNLDQDSAATLGTLVTKLKSGISTCSRCFRFFSLKNETMNPPLCSICLDHNRDQQTIMILTQDTDINVVEQRKMYNGLYFVMGKNAELGSLDPIALPRLRDLEKRILQDAGQSLSASTESGMESNAIKEVILAMNANTEGEHTAMIIERRLRDICASLQPERRFRITALGRGLSTGTELEYSDAETLKSAIENRR